MKARIIPGLVAGVICTNGLSGCASTRYHTEMDGYRVSLERDTRGIRKEDGSIEQEPYTKVRVFDPENRTSITYIDYKDDGIVDIVRQYIDGRNTVLNFIKNPDPEMQDHQNKAMRTTLESIRKDNAKRAKEYTID